MPHCIYCLKELNSGAEFCAGCGRPTGRAGATATRATASTPAANRSAGNAQDSYRGQAAENLSLFGYFVKCLKKNRDFRGRARRKELWGFLLYGNIISASMTAVSFFASGAGTSAITNSLFALALLIPTITVYVRRLHDVGKSGWNLLWCVTLIGVIPVVIWTLFCDGKSGTNRYGMSPKYPKANSRGKLELIILILVYMGISIVNKVYNVNQGITEIVKKSPSNPLTAYLEKKTAKLEMDVVSKMFLAFESSVLAATAESDGGYIAEKDLIFKILNDRNFKYEYVTSAQGGIAGLKVTALSDIGKFGAGSFLQTTYLPEKGFAHCVGGGSEAVGVVKSIIPDFFSGTGQWPVESYDSCDDLPVQ